MEDRGGRLRVSGRRIWRRRGWCVGVAWLTCALGWTGVASLPVAYRSSALLLIETSGDGPTEWDHIEGLAALDVHRMLSSRAAWQGLPGDPPDLPEAGVTLAARLTVAAAGDAFLEVGYTDDDRAAAGRVLRTLLAVVEPSRAGAEAAGARLTDDLEAARARRETYRRELAAAPPAAPAEASAGVNPVRERFAVLLDQQDALIASLEQRLRTRAQARRLRVVEPASAAVRTGRPAHLLLSLVLLTGLAAGGAAAALAARLDPRFDRAAELQRAFALPVLGSIARGSASGRRPWRWRAEPRLGVACLGLIALFAGLLTLEAFDLLAIPVAGAHP